MLMRKTLACGVTQKMEERVNKKTRRENNRLLMCCDHPRFALIQLHTSKESG